MKLEAVTVCVNYSDFLEHSLPDNIQHFDRLVVVTRPDDQATRNLCQKYSIECVQTTVMHDHGDPFNKGKAINLGLSHLRGEGWILHLDADIVLPHNFRNLLQHARLRHENLYGADRVNVYGWDHWQLHKHKRIPSHSSGYFVEPPHEFPLGARIIHQDHGYCPIGFFQLFHKSMFKKYPMVQGTAEHTDVLFACQWARYQRILLPEVIVYHLESERVRMGTNWQGRKTKRFGPECHHKPPSYKPHS